MDYGALPPEVNSGRMYTGPGSASLIAAAAAWDELAAELYTVAAAYSSTTSGLAGAWTGPAAVSMARAAAPYAVWLSATADQAERAASQARAAASAYEAAFAATVPPPEIAANRAQLLLLVATNVLGQNAPAIAATEAQYEQMWAQDAVVMYGYAGASAAASTLAPFGSPPATTDPAGAARQGAAAAQAAGASAGTQAQEVLSTGSQLISALPQALRGLGSMPTPASWDATLTSLTSYMSKFNTFSTPMRFATYPMTFLNQAMAWSKAATAPAAAAAKAAESGLAGGVRALGALGVPGTGGGAAFSAGLGRGVPIGALSVPQGWLTTPVTSPAAAGIPSAGWAAPFGGPGAGAPTGLPVMPLANLAGRGAAGPASSRFELRASVVPRSPAAG